MTIFVGRREVAGDLLGDITRLELLIGDLRKISAGHRPSAADLAAAPIIDAWAIGRRTSPCLVGSVHGHPELRGPLSVTSDLWVFAPDLGWARTLSRYYRLGRPAGTANQS